MNTEITLQQHTIAYPSFSHLPNLRILILPKPRDQSVTPSIEQSLIHAFNRLPKLEYIVMHGMVNDAKVIVSFQFSIATRDEGGEVSKLQCKDIQMRPQDIYTNSWLWWTVYEDMLPPVALW